MGQQRRSENGVAWSWAARTRKALSDWRWLPVLGRVGLGMLALVLLSVLGAGGLRPAGASPDELTVASVVSSASASDVDGLAAQASVPPVALPSSSSPGDRAIDCEVNPPRGVTEDGRVVLNVASETELRTLPGVGPARAAAIAELRERLGRFRRVEELLRVRGIGPRSLQKLRPLVVVDAPVTDD